MHRFLSQTMRTFSIYILLSRRINTRPANIRPDKDFLKKSFVFVFRKRLQDVLIKTNVFVLIIRLQKTPSRHFQDVLVRANIFVLAIRLQDVFKTSCKNVFKKLCKNVFNTSSRRLQGVLKTSCKDVFKTLSRRIINLYYFC